MWKIGPKDKYIHKYKQDHVYTYRKNMFATVELLEGRKGG
jgi:hypothetical protein